MGTLSTWLCSADYFANPSNHKWHLIRRKSSAKRKFTGSTTHFITREGKTFQFRLKHAHESCASLSTPLLTQKSSKQTTRP